MFHSARVANSTSYLQLPLVNPKDTPADQGDVVDYGIQEGDTEGLFYSGNFIEKIDKGVSAGFGLLIEPIH